MKLFVASLFVVILLIDPGQVKKDLSSIKTEQEAKAYLSKSGLKGRILELDEARDSSAAALKLYRAKPNEIIEIISPDKTATYFYKTLTSKESEVHRVQYVFFDNNKLTKKRIDSLRAIVMKRIKAGETFETMASEYSMDTYNSKRGGDLGWYDPQTMVAGFTVAVRSHARGEVFLVDLPAEKWYYVVRKSHDARKRKQIKALYIAVPMK